MLTYIINAINPAGERTQYQIQQWIDSDETVHIVDEDGNPLRAAENMNAGRDYVEDRLKWTGYHMEDLIRKHDDFATAIAFELQEDGSLIVKTFEWMGGRYVQLGPEERYSVECAQEEFGYC